MDNNDLIKIIKNRVCRENSITPDDLRGKIDQILQILTRIPKQQKYHYQSPELLDFYKGMDLNSLQDFHKLILYKAAHSFDIADAPVKLPPSFKALYQKETARIDQLIQDDSFVFDWKNDRFAKDMGIFTGRLIPIGPALFNISGIPRILLFRGGLSQFFRFLFLLIKLRGNKPVLSSHMNLGNIAQFNEETWESCYKLIAEIFALNPEYKALMRSSWFIDPAIAKISPKLAYIRRTAVQNGASIFYSNDEDERSGAFSRSKTRLELYKQGKYVPKLYYMVWPRADLIRYVRQKTHRPKDLILYGAKYLGLFYLAKKLQQKELCILCYHGFSYADEHVFRPRLFMTPQTFEKRMAYLKNKGFNVLPLGEAVDKLARNTLPPNSVVITIDDGWTGTADYAAPTLRAHHFPATLYLTTYYVEKQTQVINMAIQYLFWQTPAAAVDVAAIHQHFFGTDAPADMRTVSHLETKVLNHVNNLETVTARQTAVWELAELLGRDSAALKKEKLFYLIDDIQAQELLKCNIDIQLHTHRHTLGALEESMLERELADNAKVIKRLHDAPLEHFCYPSGNFAEPLFQTLRKNGIKTATTCINGFNTAQTNPYALNRLLDGEYVSQIEFEAEVNGFMELLRKLKALARRPSTHQKALASKVSA